MNALRPDRAACLLPAPPQSTSPAGSRPPRHPPPALRPLDRGRLRRPDAPFHLLPRRPAPTDDTEGRGDQAREVEVTEFKLWNKPKALDKLGEHLGLWSEKPEQGGVNLNVNLTVEDLARVDEMIREVEAEIDGVELPALPAPTEAE